MKNTPNTYALLIRSEEKGRSIFEGIVIGAIVLCTAFTGWQFASSSVVLPGMGATKAQVEAPMVAKALPADQIVLADRS